MLNSNYIKTYFCVSIMSGWQVKWIFESMTRDFHGNQVGIREETQLWVIGTLLPLTGDPRESVCGWPLAVALRVHKSQAPNASCCSRWCQWKLGWLFIANWSQWVMINWITFFGPWNVSSYIILCNHVSLQVISILKVRKQVLRCDGICSS